MSLPHRSLLPALALLLAAAPLFAQKEHGFDNRKPSGQPYVSAEESIKRFKVHPDYEVKVFAAEPDVINPVAFTVDEKGRLWVVECFEYPKKTQPGKMPRDRIKVLEDTDGDGKADKATVWAEGKDFPNKEYPTGFDLATGIEVGDGGVYLGAAPFLFHLRDTDRNGKCDTHEVLLRGFGSQDTHETLNTFQWGPDGRLYGLHGVFTQSKVGEVQMNAAVWRYDTRGKKFEIFGEGTSNPWGMDFDNRGQCFLACCVIPHLFHISPGGTYKRQAGSSFNPHAYGLLNEICDHTHHKESGWAHAGLLYLDGDHVPQELRGSLIMGSIHGCAIKRNVLKTNGSTFIGSKAPDFLTSDDKNLRPINLRWGPDGSIYLIDWHDQNPCHQTPPDNWDYKHGRIYKIQRKGTKKSEAVDLAKKSNAELVELLKHDGSPWWYRTALRLLGERNDKAVVPALQRLALKDKNAVHALRGLWGLHAVGGLDASTALALLSHEDAAIRLWMVRLMVESSVDDKATFHTQEDLLKQLATMAEKDPAPEVRLQLATSSRKLEEKVALGILHRLMKHKDDSKDPCLPLMIWLAYEPRLAAKANPSLEWLKENAPDNALVTEAIVPRAMRRLIATGKAEDLAACVAFVGDVKNSAVRRHALAGMNEALKGRQMEAPTEWRKVFAELMNDADAEVQKSANRLAVTFRDATVIRRALATAPDASKSKNERLEAVRALALALPAEGQPVLLKLVTADGDLELRSEACRALSGYNAEEIARTVLGGWKNYPPSLRIEAVNVLAGRKEWARALLSAVGDKRVARTDLTDNTILRMRGFRDGKLDEQIRAVWGQFRDTPAELAKLIDKMRGELHQAPASFERGRKVFENQCAKCHKFDGKGHEVGPNLDGAARDVEYLLANVLDPNRVVGAPYFTRLATLKSGRLEAGLLVAEDDTSITIKVENDARKVILKKDIDELQVQEKSVMPEGLGNAMTVQDFRDLIRYVMAHPFVANVEVSGPYGIKEKLPLNPARSETFKDAKWSQPTVGAPGRIPLPTAAETARAFVVAEVEAPSAMKTRLQLGTAGDAEVWLNGKQVYQGRPGNGPAAPDQAGADVELKEGKNVVVIQVTYKGEGQAIYARLLDPDRKLRYAEPK